MNRGLYTAASGMMLQMARQDNAANNLANVNTSGYKKDSMVSEAFPGLLISRLNDKTILPNGEVVKKGPYELGPVSTGAVVAAVYTDYSPGMMAETGNYTDLAIGTDGYFCLTTPQGERLTRNGEFHINDQGILVSNEGYPVRDVNDQEIMIPLRDPNDPTQIIPYDQIGQQPFVYDREFTVTANGEVMQGNQQLAVLKVVSVADPNQLTKEGNSFIATAANTAPMNAPRIMQGVRESSNVNAVREMVDMISITRTYEACQKVVQAEDDLNNSAINSVGTVV